MCCNDNENLFHQSFLLFAVILSYIRCYYYLGFTFVDRYGKKLDNGKLHTYIIGHYYPSVRIIDLVSHTTYVVCVNFIHKWRDLQFKVDSERQIF